MLVALAEYLQTTITDDQLVMYTKELEPYGKETLACAITQIKQGTERFYGKFPLPGEIIRFIAGNDDDYALESALKIIRSVEKFGWPNPTEAHQFIGELGWSVVQAYGGWVNVCKMLDQVEKTGIYQTQFHKSAKMMLNRARLPSRDGGSLLPPQFRRQLDERPKEIGAAVSVGSVIARLTEQGRAQEESNSVSPEITGLAKARPDR